MFRRRRFGWAGVRVPKSGHLRSCRHAVAHLVVRSEGPLFLPVVHHARRRDDVDLQYERGRQRLVDVRTPVSVIPVILE